MGLNVNMLTGAAAVVIPSQDGLLFCFLAGQIYFIKV